MRSLAEAETSLVMEAKNGHGGAVLGSNTGLNPGVTIKRLNL